MAIISGTIPAASTWGEAAQNFFNLLSTNLSDVFSAPTESEGSTSTKPLHTLTCSYSSNTLFTYVSTTPSFNMNVAQYGTDRTTLTSCGICGSLSGADYVIVKNPNSGSLFISFGPGSELTPIILWGKAGTDKYIIAKAYYFIDNEASGLSSKSLAACALPRTSRTISDKIFADPFIPKNVNDKYIEAPLDDFYSIDDDLVHRPSICDTISVGGRTFVKLQTDTYLESL